jgi:hypothetical protein
VLIDPPEPPAVSEPNRTGGASSCTTRSREQLPVPSSVVLDQNVEILWDFFECTFEDEFEANGERVDLVV